MYFTKVSLKNYKSFGKENNFLYLDRITAVLGKNESGKSNLINGLGEINFFSPSNLSSKRNRLFEEPAEIDVDLAFDDSDEIEEKFREKTTAHFENGKFCTFSGGLANFLSDDDKIQSSQSFLLQTIRKNNNTDSSTKNEFISWLSSTIPINFPSNLEKAKRLKSWILTKLNSEERAEAMESVDYIIGKLEKIQQILPAVFFYEPHEYKNRYTVEALNKLNEAPNKHLEQLLAVANIDPMELKKAMSSSTDSGRRCLIRKEIDQKLKDLAAEFNKFYNNEIKVVFDIENDYFDLLIASSEFPMPFSDRSSGLKWYFDFFVQLKNQNLLNHKLLLLVDEPGIHLHINAQQTLLNLFRDLSEKNQIVYTTHSPFMIDTNNLSSIRFAENRDGLTLIHNHMYSAPIANASKMEILSPLVQAIGFSQKFNIGPDHTKINLLVEGLSDYYYLRGAAALCKIATDNFSIIPCNGVNNIHHVASILFGWGYDFKIIMDYDKRAYDESNILDKAGLRNNVDYFTYNLKPIDRVQMNQNPFTVENLFSEEESAIFAASDKIRTSLKFYELASAGKISLCAKTKDRFLKIFSLIDSKKSGQEPSDLPEELEKLP